MKFLIGTFLGGIIGFFYAALLSAAKTRDTISYEGDDYGEQKESNN